MTDAVHPARSTEFLSRLYDDELAPDESQAFAAHRAGCEECRRAAESFASTLAAYRSSPTALPAPDLSARILRKIRAQSPARRPFGVTFGIDIRWAGIFVAALLVVLLAAPLLLRRAPLVRPAKPSSIPARILEEAPSAQSAAPPRADDRPQRAPARPPAASVPAAPEGLAKDEANVASAPAKPAPRPEAPAEEEKGRAGLAPRTREKAAPGRLAAEPSGGEAAAGTAPDFAEAPSRVFVLPADEQGPPPMVVSRPAADRLVALRGREFVLLVEAGGRVRSVAAPGSGAPAAAADTQILREIRFAPGDRPRRLSVRVE